MTGEYALKASQIVTETDIRKDCWLHIADGRIVNVDPEPPADGMACFDLGAMTIIPGLIDIHIHGREGCDVMDADAASLGVIATSLARQGVTSYLATTVTADWRQTLKALRIVADKMAQPTVGAQLLGAYSEGLFFSCEHRGAHNPNFFIAPHPKLVDEMIDASYGALKVLALAPEIDGAMDTLRHAVRRGLKVSLGHTDATYEQTRAALGDGAVSGVHVFNGMRGIHHREPGCAGALMLEDCFVEVIADGVHLHPAILQMITRLKNRDSVLLISDCMCAGGMADGLYRLGEMDVLVKDGTARTLSGGLAGSTLTVDRAIARMIRETGIDLRDAVHMASLNPARFLDIADQTGSITPGKRADIAIFDSSGHVRATLVGGRSAWLDPTDSMMTQLADIAPPQAAPGRPSPARHHTRAHI